MICPQDQTEMTAQDRHGVHFMRCPRCGGVWLDAEAQGRLVALGLAGSDPVAAAVKPGTGHRYGGQYSRGAKPKPPLEELFDFD